MKTKLLLATLALAMSPTLAMAMGCGFGHAKDEQIVMSCAVGSVYDAEAHRCVPTTG
ncbi:MAG: hypothetical protein GKR98_04025 [Boseongicola sp.]|nr:MAG: hypothetical protein GKR98_04025 [Boseongicola sp.]